MRTLVTLLPLLVFIIIGVFGVFSQDFIQMNSSVFNWFIFPAFILGVYYAFALTPTFPRNEGGGIALGRIGITVFITALGFRAIQGYVIFSNCYVGHQDEALVSGMISQVNFPMPKKMFDKNSILIIENNNRIKIALEVPTDNYHVGQIFNKNMLRGSFGILYSPQ